MAALGLVGRGRFRLSLFSLQGSGTGSGLQRASKLTVGRREGRSLSSKPVSVLRHPVSTRNKKWAEVGDIKGASVTNPKTWTLAALEDCLA